jgi:hypothetical protein
VLTSLRSRARPETEKLTPNFRAKWVGLYPSSRHEDAGDLS